MTLRSLPVAALLAFATLPLALRAQEETSGMEEERMRALTEREAQAEQWLGPRNKVTVSFRVLASGGKVDFKNLGAVPAKFISPASDGAVDRKYDNGTVQADGLRNEEVDANGNQISSPGGRYQTFITLDDGTKEQSGDLLSYTPGRTRNWQEVNDSQLTERPGYVAFTAYSTTSEGGHFTDKPGPSAGVELNFSRDLGRLTRRIQWGFSAGIVLNGINSKMSGEVTSTLNAHTDYYQILGGATDVGAAPASAPSYNIFINPTSGNIYALGTETTTPLSQTQDSVSNDVATHGGATVNGRWQVHGGYFMVKIGPSFRTQFNDHLELSGSAGFAGAYTGTSYTATESFAVADLPGVDIGVSDPQVSNTTKFLKGYYADLTLEWAANDYTGIFGGVTAQQLQAYDQMVADRIAHVDLGSTVGIRAGLSIRF